MYSHCDFANGVCLVEGGGMCVQTPLPVRYATLPLGAPYIYRGVQVHYRTPPLLPVRHTLHTWQRTASSRPTALDRCSAEPTSGKLSPPAPPAQCNQLTTHGRRISVHCSRGICGLGCPVACLLPASYSLTASSNSPESSASDTPITRTPPCETRHICTVNISQGGTCTEHTRPSL
jgi:hypothetical protein